MLKKLIALMCLTITMFSASMLAERVMCVADSHLNIEYSSEDEGDCHSNCGDCVDIPLPHLATLTSGSVDAPATKYILSFVVLPVFTNSLKLIVDPKVRLAFQAIIVTVFGILLSLQSVVLLI